MIEVRQRQNLNLPVDKYSNLMQVLHAFVCFTGRPLLLPKLDYLPWILPWRSCTPCGLTSSQKMEIMNKLQNGLYVCCYVCV